MAFTLTLAAGHDASLFPALAWHNAPACNADGFDGRQTLRWKAICCPAPALLSR